MKINFINYEKELEFAIKVLGERLNFQVVCDKICAGDSDKNGADDSDKNSGGDCGISNYDICVSLKKCDGGLKLQKNGSSACIEYSSIVTFCRACLLLCDSAQRENVQICEQCCFESFGMMVDNSRNAVLKPQTAKEYAVNLALMGYNQMLLYTEDTFEVKNQPYFGYMRGRFTSDEFKEIDSFCEKLGIELVPCIQTLAHLNQIARYASYDKIIDCNDILFADMSDTYRLIEDMFSTVAECFKSRKINIGMDEAHMLGLGKYLDKFGYTRRFDIMVNHLNKVKAIADKYGFKIEMWSDMFFRLLNKGEYYCDNIDGMPQEVIAAIDKDITLIYWDYYSVEYNRYDRMLKNHLALSDNVSFAGGAWKWAGFAPDNTFSIAANKQALAACKNNGIKRFLLTAWGDNGAEASSFSILPCMFLAANHAYAAKGNIDGATGNIDGAKGNVDDGAKGNIDGANSYLGFSALTGINIEDFLLIDTPNKLLPCEILERANPCKFMLYNDALQGAFDSEIPQDIAETYLNKAKALKTVAQTNSRYSYLFDTLYKLCEVLTVKADLSKKIKAAYDKKNNGALKSIAKKTIPSAIEKLKDFYTAFKKQWNNENKPLGFEVQAIRIGGLIQRLQDVAETILNYIDGKISKIDECEGERLKMGYYEGVGSDRMSYNLWSVNVSASAL